MSQAKGSEGPLEPGAGAGSDPEAPPEAEEPIEPESALAPQEPPAGPSDAPSTGIDAPSSDAPDAPPAGIDALSSGASDAPPAGIDAPSSGASDAPPAGIDAPSSDAPDAPPPAEPPAPSAEPPGPPPEPRRRADVAALFRALAGLSVAGISIGGAVAEAVLRAQLDKLITKNELGPRKALENSMLLGGALFALPALIYLVIGLFRRDLARRVDALHRLATFTLPLTLVFLIPPLFRWSAWLSLPLELGLLTTAFGLALEPLLRLSQRSAPGVVVRAAGWIASRFPERASRWIPPAIVAIAAVGYALFAARYTLMHHHRLGTACYDLGQYDNLFYNALHGHPFRVPSISGEEDWQSLRGHAEIGMYALLPLYALRPGPAALLVVQAALLGSAAIPLYLFGVRFLSRWAAMLVTLAYVFYAPMHRANFYDFHMQPVAAVFILWMLYFLVARRHILFWIAFLLALSTREDISIGLAVLGTFLVLTGYRLKTGIAITFLSAAYFVVLKWYVMPMFGEWWFADIYKQLQIPGSKGYGSIIETLLSSPVYVFTTLVTKEKLGYAIQILMPLAFLPLRRPQLALAVVPGFVFTLLTTGYSPTVSIQFQYNAHWIPYIFPAAIVALRMIGGEPGKPDLTGAPARPAEPAPEEAKAHAEGTIRRRAALATMAALSLVSSYHYGALLQRNSFKGGFSKIDFAMTPAEEQRYQDLREIVAQIPPRASVAASEHLAPHVSTRSSLYCFRGSIGIAEYVVFGMVDKNTRTSKALKDLLSKGKLGVIAEKGAFTLLRRGADTSKNDAFVKKL